MPRGPVINAVVTRRDQYLNVTDLQHLGFSGKQPGFICSTLTEGLIDVVLCVPGDRGLDDHSRRCRITRDPELPGLWVPEQRDLRLRASEAPAAPESAWVPVVLMSGEVLYEVGEVGVADPFDVTGSGPGVGRVDLGRKDLHRAGRVATDVSKQSEGIVRRHVVFAGPSLPRTFTVRKQTFHVRSNSLVPVPV